MRLNRCIVVPPLRDLNAFALACQQALLAWWEFDRDHIRPEEPGAPAAGESVAREILAGGPKRWHHMREEFASWYSGGVHPEHDAAEHRFWAAACLRDRQDDPEVAPWIWLQHPLLLPAATLAAAAQAHLDLWHASLDAPAEERSSFDLPDLLERARAFRAKELEDPLTYRASYRPPAASR